VAEGRNVVKKRAPTMTPLFQKISQSSVFRSLIVGVIVLAGVLVGVETSPALVQQYGPLLKVLDRAVLGVFIAEIGVKMGAEGRRPWRYFRDPWNVFDFLVVAACLLPFGTGYATVLRLARLLRVLRLVHALPKLQLLVSALLKSIPSMAYVTLLLGLLFYVYGVAGTFLFAGNDPVHFGTLALSLLTLFRVVTMEGWTELLYIQMYGCDRFGYSDTPALCTQPAAMPAAAVFFFCTFILLGTMIILNLFIGVIMNALQEAHEEAVDREQARAEAAGTAKTLEQDVAELEQQLSAMQEQLVRLRGRLSRQPQASAPEPERLRSA
jgi:voltage-gated sodium channel